MPAYGIALSLRLLPSLVPHLVKLNGDFTKHKTYFYRSPTSDVSFVSSNTEVHVTNEAHNALVPIEAEDFVTPTVSLIGLKNQFRTRVTSGAVSDYIDGLANGNYMLDVRQGVTDLPTTSHLECIVHKLDPNYITVLATDLYGNIFTRVKYTDGWHSWEQYASINEANRAIYATDLFESATVPEFVYWNANTLNTPLKSGLTTSSAGFAIRYGGNTGNQVIFAMAQGSADIFVFYRNNGNGNWIKK